MKDQLPKKLQKKQLWGKTLQTLLFHLFSCGRDHSGVETNKQIFFLLHTWNFKVVFPSSLNPAK